MILANLHTGGRDFVTGVPLAEISGLRLPAARRAHGTVVTPDDGIAEDASPCRAPVISIASGSVASWRTSQRAPGAHAGHAISLGRSDDGNAA